MSEKICITILIENSVHARGLKAEHGLAWHIQVGLDPVLFDTGQTDLLLENADKLGLPLDNLKAIVLSHGHYDHTGGLAAVCRSSPHARIFLHPAAREAKFVRSDDERPRSIGLAQTSRAALQECASRVMETRGCTEVAPRLFVTGEIPRPTTHEDVGGRFYLDEAGTQPDPMRDDQALFFDTSPGLVVLLGCAHAGVVNTLDYIRRIVPNRPFHAVLGGMHLLNASPERLNATINAFCFAWFNFPASKCFPHDYTNRD